ncbi:MAG TPA: aspartate carbamoyltransferase [Patescibacteria group bacterium]|nr:aspartate carbamoyltransferase [Patescibacteria group bacterium]
MFGKDRERMQHVTSIKQFTDKKLIKKLFDRAAQFETMPLNQYPKPLQSLTVASVFFEPSTRTRLSFETAIQNLGGQLLTVENASTSSSDKKGESLEDTIKTINAYADGIVLRHPEIGSVDRAASVSKVPVISGGDGGGEHPTQALLELYTIQKSKGKIDGLKIGIVGDLKHSRSHHSLVTLLSIFNVDLYLIAPKVIALPAEQLQELKAKGVKHHVLDSWDSVISELDVLYCNRIQKERFKFVEDYQAVKDKFILKLDNVRKMKKDAIIIDPLPRINEIDPEVDNDPRAKYFEAVKNGLYVRMALLDFLFSS